MVSDEKKEASKEKRGREGRGVRVGRSALWWWATAKHSCLVPVSGCVGII